MRFFRPLFLNFVLLIISFSPVTGSALEISKDLRRFAYTFYKSVSDPRFNAKTCVSFLADFTEQTYTVLPHHFDVASLFEADGKTLKIARMVTGPDGKKYPKYRVDFVYDSFFRARTALHDKVRGFVQNNDFAGDEEGLEKCVNQVRIAMRNARTWEDYWGQWILDRQGRISDTPQVFEGSPPHLQVRPSVSTIGVLKAGKFRFKKNAKTGDMLLSRGASFPAAVNARVGAVDNQFSHLAFVFVDDKNNAGKEYVFKNVDPNWEKGKVYVVEAIPDKGLTWGPFDDYQHHGLARVAWFRYRHMSKDLEAKYPSEKVAADAAYRMALRAREGSTGYNFSMRLDETDNLFCSQTIKVGFDLACGEGNDYKCDSDSQGNPVPFPLMKTVFGEGNPFLELVGVSIGETFSPADVEIDPRTELLGEWRDFQKVKETRIHDMITTKMMQWMEFGGYKFSPAILEKEEFQLLAELSYYGAVLTGKMPENVPVEFIKATILFGYFMMKPANGMERVALDYLGSDLGDYQGLAKSISGQVGLRNLVARVEQRSIEGAKANDPNAPEFFLTDYQIDGFLEHTRKVDCQNFKNGEPTLFHQYFRPIDSSGSPVCDLNTIPWNMLW